MEIDIISRKTLGFTLRVLKAKKIEISQALAGEATRMGPAQALAYVQKVENRDKMMGS